MVRPAMGGSQCHHGGGVVGTGIMSGGAPFIGDGIGTGWIHIGGLPFNGLGIIFLGGS
jgi:hypothetical protein